MIKLFKVLFRTGKCNATRIEKMKTVDEGQAEILFIGLDIHWYEVLKRALQAKKNISQTTMEKLNHNIQQKKYTLIILDILNLTDKKIAETITNIQNCQKDTYIVLASSSPTWKKGRAALRAGAADYITKSFDPNRIAKFLKPYL